MGAIDVSLNTNSLAAYAASRRVDGCVVVAGDMLLLR